MTIKDVALQRPYRLNKTLGFRIVVPDLWTRGVAVNMSPCHGEDRRFESGRVRQITNFEPCINTSIQNQ